MAATWCAPSSAWRSSSAVIYGLYWVLKQVKSSREERVVGARPGRRRPPCRSARTASLHLVRAGSELVLVGVAEHGVTPIRTYTEEEARAAGLIAEEGAEDDDDVDPGDRDEPAGSAKTGLRKMTIGEALERIRQATVRA